MNPSLVVCDAGPLIALSQIGRLHLLPNLFENIVAPPAVLSEISRTVQKPDWLEERSISGIPRAIVASAILGTGEKEALALAVEIRADRILIDESRGRRVAQRLGLNVVGTLGLLAAGKRVGLVSTVRPLVDELVNKHNFWLTPEVIEKTLRDLGEL